MAGTSLKPLESRASRSGTQLAIGALNQFTKGEFVNKWIKMGITGAVLVGSLQAGAEETPPDEVASQPAQMDDDSAFVIEASDLIAKKLRDFARIEEIV
jgi:hypothetical protein